MKNRRIINLIYGFVIAAGLLFGGLAVRAAFPITFPFSGGTGNSGVEFNSILIGAGFDPLATSTQFTYSTSTETLTVGSFISNASSTIMGTTTLQGIIATSTINSKSLTITGLVSCDTIDTTADGQFICGTDSTGSNVWTDSGSYLVPTNNEGILVNNASSTITSLLNVTQLHASSTVIIDGSIIISGDTISDFNGSGLTVSSNTLAVGAGTCINVGAGNVSVTNNCTDAATLDSVNSTSFLRSDTSDALTSGTLTINSGTTLAISGTLNGGGATSFEIANGANPTVDTEGEIALDTTSNQFLIATGTSAVVYGRAVQRLYAFNLGTTTTPTLENGKTMGFPPEMDGYTVYHIQCAVWGGTSVVLNLTDSANNDTNTITCTTATSTKHAIVSNNTFTDGEGMSLEIGTVTGSVERLHVSVFGAWTRD